MINYFEISYALFAALFVEYTLFFFWKYAPYAWQRAGKNLNEKTISFINNTASKFVKISLLMKDEEAKPAKLKFLRPTLFPNLILATICIYFFRVHIGGNFKYSICPIFDLIIFLVFLFQLAYLISKKKPFNLRRIIDLFIVTTLIEFFVIL